MKVAARFCVDVVVITYACDVIPHRDLPVRAYCGEFFGNGMCVALTA